CTPFSLVSRASGASRYILSPTRFAGPELAVWIASLPRERVAMPRPSSMRLGALSVTWLLLIADGLRAQSPLHDRIDQLIAAGKPDFDRQAAPLASDAEFLRRIYLDLTGTIPPPDAAPTFVENSAADKR